MKTVTEITAEKKEASEIRLAAYCRVSSGSADQRHSFAAQIQYYADYCKQNPQYKLVDVYADEAVTGTCAEKRDDFLRLMRDCRKGKIDRIIVKSVSRFARNTQELLAALRMLSEHGVSVFFEEQGIDTARMDNEMIITFPGMAAQQERLAISGNVRWRYRKRMASGEFNCTYPAYFCAVSARAGQTGDCRCAQSGGHPHAPRRETMARYRHQLSARQRTLYR